MTQSVQTKSGLSAYREVVAKYPDVSPLVILKAYLQRRGVTYSQAAFGHFDPARHLVQARSIFVSVGEKPDETPTMASAGLILRDGTTVISGPRLNTEGLFVVDSIDGKLVITDGDDIIEEVDLWEKPDYVSKTTSSGKPMWQIATPRPQRLDINPYSYCHFWDDGHGCKFCNISWNYHKEHKANNKPIRLDPRDVSETVAEAIRQPGRFTNIMLTGGSIFSGDELFADELDLYIEILQAIGENFSTRRFPSQLISSSFAPHQLARLYEETGVLTYTSDIEVLNEEKFNWICPGKTAKLGYREWKRRLVEAVGIFGRGRVNTGIVGGVETATPHGFASEDDALAATLEEADDLASQGVSTVHCVWGPTPGSVFFKQKVPSLEYYVRLSQGLDQIRRNHGLNVDMDNYRLCGNHPDSDLSRI